MNGKDVVSSVVAKVAGGLLLGALLGAGASSLAWKAEAADMVRRWEMERIETKLESLQTSVARLEARVEFLIAAQGLGK